MMLTRDLDEGSPELVLRKVAGHHLPGAFRGEPLGPVYGAKRLVALAGDTGLLGPLVSCVESGQLNLPDGDVAAAVDRHQRVMQWCMCIELRLLDVADWFDAAGGIEFMVVKGPAVAHLDEPDPALRSFADLDILIAGADMDRAIGVLTAHGVERRIPEQRAGFDRRFVKGVGMRCSDGIEIDVHRTLCGGPHGFRIPVERILANAESFDLGGYSIPAPSPQHRALHACYHAVIGSASPPLRTLRDLAGYLSRCDMPPSKIVPEAQDWRGEAVLAEAVRTTIETFQLDIPAWSDWLDHAEVHHREQRIIANAGRESSRPFEWVTIRELSWPDRTAFVWAVAVPSDEVLRHRGVSRYEWAVAGFKRLIRGVA